jgi:hypothetical protein
LKQYTLQVYEKEGIQIDNPKMDVDDDGILTDFDLSND